MDPSPKTIELLHYPGQWNLELTGSCYSTGNIRCYNPSNIFVPQLKLGTVSGDIPQMRVAKNIWRIINTIASIWLEKYARICHWALSIPRSSKFSSSFALGNCCVWEQIMSVDNCPGIFSRQMETIVYIDTIPENSHRFDTKKHKSWIAWTMHYSQWHGWQSWFFIMISINSTLPQERFWNHSLF